MTQEQILQVKEEICDIGRRIYQNGFVAANDGNISVKLEDGTFLCTPTGVSKGYMTPDMILHVDGEGKMLEANDTYRPSSEFKMHLRVYRERPDVRSVVHAHPPTATAFAVANVPLDKYIMPEAVIFLGSVPVCAYATPSTEEVPDSLMPYLQDHDAFLLQNHGALTVGDSLIRAYFNMESTEFYAKIYLMAYQIHGVNEFTEEQMAKLMDVRRAFGLKGHHPGYNGKKGTKLGVDEELVDEIVRRVVAELKK